MAAEKVRVLIPQTLLMFGELAHYIAYYGTYTVLKREACSNTESVLLLSVLGDLDYD